MSSSEILQALLKKYAEGTISRQEQIELAEMLEEHTNDEILNILQPLHDLRKHPEEDTAQQRNWQTPMLEAIKAHDPVPVVSMPARRLLWIRFAAAAILILSFGIAAWMYMNRPAGEQNLAVRNHTTDTPLGTTAITAPHAEKILTSKTLRNVASGHRQTDTCGLKIPGSKDDVVRMKMTDDSISVSIPRSWQYALTLPDGSNVLLNAASSVSYPKNFNGDSRGVCIKGEAFFMIAENDSRPFYVISKGRRFAAQGAAFNINAYEKEVMVSVASKDKTWTEGYFAFSNKGIKETMNELARWYNWNVVYNHPSKRSVDNVSGSFCRRTSEPDALKEMESLGISFQKRGNDIIVL